MKLLSNMLTGFIKTGTLIITDSAGKEYVFQGTPGPTVRMKLHDAKLPSKIFRNPELTVGEAYMDGTLTFEGCTVYDFLYLFSINRQSLTDYPLQQVVRRISKALRFIQQHNPVGKAQENVAHHYDLPVEFYSRFLDPDLQYSCAFFADPEASLEAAQNAKIERLAAKLLLQPHHRVLDIGCGWGGLSLRLARDHGVHVRGATLSAEQAGVGKARAAQYGLTDRLAIDLVDYRDLDGVYDRIV
ncbi:class I SAM-dependent methyltransferase, partial [bacterium]